MHANWFKTVFLYLDRNTELARAVDVIMAQAKRIYNLMIKVNKLINFFASLYFLKEIENMFSVFLSSYRNTRESLGELKQAVKTPVLPQYFSFSQTFTCVSITRQKHGTCFLFVKCFLLLMSQC